MKDNYWLHKNVLITGINGFIGGNVSKALIEKGANVFGLIRNLNKHTYLFFEELADNVVLIKGELNDKELMARIISEDHINVVFHLAAQSLVKKSYSNPTYTWETNTIGTLNILEALNEIIPCVILAGGKGRRMGGKEKALIHLLDRPLLSYVLEKVSGKVAPIALNIKNEDHNNEYHKKGRLIS